MTPSLAIFLVLADLAAVEIDFNDAVVRRLAELNEQPITSLLGRCHFDLHEAVLLHPRPILRTDEVEAVAAEPGCLLALLVEGGQPWSVLPEHGPEERLLQVTFTLHGSCCRGLLG